MLEIIVDIVIILIIIWAITSIMHLLSNEEDRDGKVDKDTKDYLEDKCSCLKRGCLKRSRGTKDISET